MSTAWDEVEKLDWDFTPPSKTFTHAEWKEMTANDEVIAFYERVNQRAVNDPLWDKNYYAAIYNARLAEYSEYVMKKYNNGEGFVVRGESHPAEAES